MLLKDAVQEYIITKTPETTVKTIKWYEHKLRLFSEWCETQKVNQLESVNNTVVLNFSKHMEGKSSYTVKRYVQVVKGFLNWCVEYDEGEVSERTIRKIRSPKVERSEVTIFSKEEILRLQDAAKKSSHPQRNLTLLQVLLDTGLRAAELVYDSSRPQEETGLMLEEVHINKAESYIRVMGKGRKERDLPLGKTSKNSVRLYMRRYRGKSDSPYVFLSRTGEPLTVRGLESTLDDLAQEANVLEISTKILRY